VEPVGSFFFGPAGFPAKILGILLAEGSIACGIVCAQLVKKITKSQCLHEKVQDMSESLSKEIRRICQECQNDRGRLMDIVTAVQKQFGHVNAEAIDAIAEALGCPRVQVQSVVTFYAFYSEQPKGRIIIRLCNDIIDRMAGVDLVADAFRDELGIDFGQTTPDGKISLEWTPCIGMSDQAPACMVNDVIVPWLHSDDARRIVRELREHMDPRKLVRKLGDGNNAHPKVRAMVVNNIRRKGAVVFQELPAGDALKKALAMSPVEVIRDVKAARLRGRGGAGFPRA
jgi:[NiFe] hydrogenase diaphorase moiety large subunit